MAAYGTALAFAKTLGQEEVADLLNATLEEETETNDKLTSLSEDVNEEANASSEAEDSDSPEPVASAKRNK
jgi:ferritin-like metal-binding protein YciE